MRGWSLEWTKLFAFGLVLTFPQITFECPLACDCKWKSGKESVLCSVQAHLTSIPRGLDPGTQVLDLTGNLVENLPADVFLTLNLLNLQKIFLSSCQIYDVDPNAFAKLTNLVELDLAANRLEAVPSESFESIPELRDLKLSSNPITILKDGAFSSLSRLVRLELIGCRLGTIERNAFIGLHALEWLRLDNNRLNAIQGESFISLRSLHGLGLHGNPWNCTCELRPLREWMTKNKVPFTVPPLCTGPERLRGKPWDRLLLQDFDCIPKISNQKSTGGQRVIEGENATFECKFTATSQINVRWFNSNKGGGVVGNGTVGATSTFILRESFDWVKDRQGTKTSKLTIYRVSSKDSGTYTCQAENAAGFVHNNFSLTVVRKNKEEVGGRLILIGVLLSAFFMVLLLCCVIAAMGRFRSSRRRRTLLEKIELDHMTAEIGAEQLASSGQNGGHNVPLLFTNEMRENDEDPRTAQQIATPHLSNHQRFEGSESKGRDNETHYSLLSTTDIDEDGGSGCAKRPTGKNSGRCEWKELKRKLPPEPNPFREPPPRTLALRSESQESTRGSTKVVINLKGARSSNYCPDETRHAQRVPDLITQKEWTEFGSLSRHDRNTHDRYSGSYFHRRNNSDSQSPLLSQSFGHSSERLPEGRYFSSTCVGVSTPSQWTPSQRLSMPTSPVHEPATYAATYDYHAAQLAAFLHEYRALQLELMRMSASLTAEEEERESHCARSHPRNPHQLKSILKNSSTTNNNYMS